MRLIRVGAATLNQTPLDWRGNAAHILGAIAEAREREVSVLCLPEMCISGYGCEDAFLSPGLQRTSWEVLQEILPATRGMVVSLGIPMLFYDAVYNTACLAVDGRIAGFVGKRNLAGEGLHYEPRWFKPWTPSFHGRVEIDGASYPIGDVYFELDGIRIGFEICEDAWVANRPGGSLALQGADLILNPSASHFAFGKQEIRKRFVLEGSRAFGVSYLYANLAGNEAGRILYDGGALVASSGRILAAGPRFDFADWTVTAATVDVDLTRMEHARTGSYVPNLARQVAECIKVDFAIPEVEPRFERDEPVAWEASPHAKEEEFTRALAVGLFDYLRKSRAHGFAVSLSGGADSAAVSCLVALMVDLAIADLGRERFLERLSHVDALRDLTPATASPREVVGRLLTCAYQSTENSGEVTRSAARTVAAAIGADFLELDVDPFFRGYVEMIEGALGRELTWQRDDLALQNIQARVRAPGIWLLANLRRALLLTTSNRSEAAVGYATMDGDTAGGLAPIGGIDKAFLRQWLTWLEEIGPVGSRPIPELAVVNRQAPTAELRPPGEGQTDEADLMPYDLLDAIERAAIRDKRTPVEVYRLMRPRFPQYGNAQLGRWVARFFRLWSQNQWKRERYAPSFHLDDENLDPKTWCRFPILSGGFDRELEQLRGVVAAEAEKETAVAGPADAAAQPAALGATRDG